MTRQGRVWGDVKSSQAHFRLEMKPRHPTPCHVALGMLALLL